MRTLLLLLALFAGPVFGNAIQPQGKTSAMQAPAMNPAAPTVLVILAKFSDSPAQTFTKAQAQAQIDSAIVYFREVSYGKLNMTATLTDWVTVPMTRAQYDYGNFGLLAEVAARAANPAWVRGSGYVAYVSPDAACGFLEAGILGGVQSWYCGTAQFTQAYMAHALGHNFGLQHSGAMQCLGSRCGYGEYGDFSNAMGLARPGHYAASQKAALGFLPAAAVKTYTGGTQTFTLDAVEGACTGTCAVKVPTSIPGRTYWVEVRDPGKGAGFDKYLSGGVQIRVAAPFEQAGLDQSLDAAMVPGGLLSAGESYTDPVAALTITVSPAAAFTITVSPGGVAPPPTVPPTSDWAFLADDGKAFAINGTRTVRYGLGSLWMSKVITGSGMCDRAAFGGDPAYGQYKRCEVATAGLFTPAPPPPPMPGNWARIADQDGKFSVTNKRVRFGVGTLWTALGPMSGAVICDRGWFGADPAPGQYKHCEVEQ